MLREVDPSQRKACIKKKVARVRVAICMHFTPNRRCDSHCKTALPKARITNYIMDLISR